MFPELNGGGGISHIPIILNKGVVGDMGDQTCFHVEDWQRPPLVENEVVWPSDTIFLVYKIMAEIQRQAYFENTDYRQLRRPQYKLKNNQLKTMEPLGSTLTHPLT